MLVSMCVHVHMIAGLSVCLQMHSWELCVNVKRDQCECTLMSSEWKHKCELACR